MGLERFKNVDLIGGTWIVSIYSEKLLSAIHVLTGANIMFELFEKEMHFLKLINHIVLLVKEVIFQQTS